MVETWWQEREDTVISIMKMRIKHHEKHGCGNNTIKDKQKLKEMERHRELHR